METVSTNLRRATSFVHRIFDLEEKSSQGYPIILKFRDIL